MTSSSRLGLTVEQGHAALPGFSLGTRVFEALSHSIVHPVILKPPQRGTPSPASAELSGHTSHYDNS